MMTVLVQHFGRFVASTRYKDLPEAVVEAVKIHFLDTIGAGLAGFHLGNHKPLLNVVQGNGGATVWGLGLRYPPRDATLLNSFLAHSCYIDDGSRFTGGHPSSVVIPSALALAESQDTSGMDLIAATAAGYEIFLRLGRAIYPSVVNRGFQSTAVLGAVASAAACASVLGLDTQGSQNALAIACNLGVGLKEALKSSRSQPLQVGRSCEAGLFSALYAREGEVGVDSIIENGFFKAFANEVNDQGMLEGLGSDFRIFETYIKVHGGCRGNHAPIDVIRAIVTANGIAASEIERIGVEVDSVTFAAEIHEPINGAQAQFSIAFAIAVAIAEGNASVFQYTDKKLSDPKIRRLMERVQVAADPALDDGYPDKRGARAEVVLKDGRRFVKFLENARGEPEFPLTRGEIEEKFFIIGDAVLGANSRPVHDLIMKLETLPSVRELAEKLVRNDNRR
jgi:2-methylcitrate dehydratase PrpD